VARNNKRQMKNPRRIAFTIAFAAVLLADFAAIGQPAHNVLSDKERAAGWRLLFDGETMNHWIDPSKEAPPGTPGPLTMVV
jgi:hypothetical protein